MDTHNWRDDVYENIQELKDILPVTDLHLYWINTKNPTKAFKQSNHSTYKKVDLGANDERVLVKMAAERKQMIFIRNMNDFQADTLGVALSFNADSALYIPIMNFKHQVLVVMELYRLDGNRMTQNVFVYIQEFAMWFAAWLSQRCECNEEARRANFHDILVSYFLEFSNKSTSFEQFLNRFLKSARDHLQADKYYLYDYNIDTNFSDFYEEIDGKVTKTATRLKYFKRGSFCEQVREEGKAIIADIDDGFERLEKEIKQNSEFPLRYIIFSPLTFGDRYLGIVAFGKLKGDTVCEFSEDEVLDVFRISSLLANALANRFIVQEKDRQTAQTQMLRQTLVNLLHARMRDQFTLHNSIALPSKIIEITWELENKNDPHQLTYMCKMLNAVYSFDAERIKQFLLCVQIAHNDAPYHNIRTTFHIVRTIYCITSKLDRLKPFERASLLIAALGYCCSHNGLDNRTMLKIGHPLALLYRNYMKENHRVWTLGLLMDQARLLDGIAEAEQIVSTINSLLLNQRKYTSKMFCSKIQNMLETETFNLELRTHLSYALSIIFRMGVLGRHMQVFSVATELRDNFYKQAMVLGDIGRSHGINVPDYQDSNQKNQICKFEVRHLEATVIPTLKIMIMMFPEAGFLEPMPRDTLKAYEILVNTGDKRLWDPKTCQKKNRLQYKHL